MKKTFLFTGLALAGIACLLMGNTCNHQEHAQTLGTEDIIDLSKDNVTANQGVNYEDTAKQNIFIVSPGGKQTVYNYTFNLRKKDDIDSLHRVAHRLANGYSGRYITAIQVLYGVVPSTYQLELFIRPLFLEYNMGGSSGTSGYTANKYSLNYNTNPFYVLNSSTYGIALVSQSKYIADSLFYQSAIQIIHYYSDPTKKFIPNVDLTSVIYPFQELDTVMTANTNILVNSVNNIDTIVNLINIGYPPGVPNYIKHDILLAPNFLSFSDKSMVVFPCREYADLSNMCPPDCPSEEVYYIIK